MKKKFIIEHAPDFSSPLACSIRHTRCPAVRCTFVRYTQAYTRDTVNVSRNRNRLFREPFVHPPTFLCLSVCVCVVHFSFMTAREPSKPWHFPRTRQKLPFHREPTTKVDSIKLPPLRSPSSRIGNGANIKVFEIRRVNIQFTRRIQRANTTNYYPFF